MSIAYARMPSPIGEVWIAESASGVCAIGIGAGQPEAFFETLSQVIDPGPPYEDPPALAPTLTQLQEYFSGMRRTFDLPLDVRGTDFQKLVWEEARQAPYGTTTTYGEIARRLGNPCAARAVGAALSANRLPILIPCHRVIGAGDKLRGYSGGVEIKATLLQLEGVLLS